MGESTYQEEAPIKAEEIVVGRWDIVFQHVGLGEYMEFTRKEGPCPICGGNTRFRFLDLEETGRHFCSSCPDMKKGVGFGFRLLMQWKGCNFMEAANIVKEALGVQRGAGPSAIAKLPPRSQPKHEKSDAEVKAGYEELWEQGFELSPSNAAGKYVLRRAPGLKSLPAMLRFHPRLPYFEALSKEEAARSGRKFRKVGEFPGMLGYVQSHTGELAVIWRWFLTPDGHKAEVPEPKKAAGRWLTNDGALRLYEPTDVLGASEGAETGLAVMAMHGIPCWAAINAGSLAKFQVPADVAVKRLYVYGDNDEAKAISASRPGGIRRGNEVAKALAQRMKEQGLPAFVRMPNSTGFDFADIHQRRAST